MELDGITKCFEENGRQLKAIDDVSFKVKSGELLAIMGPSGCGKSTLLRIMAGLIPPDKGSIGSPPRQTGFVFQNFGLMPWLTVTENIGFGLKMAGDGPAHIHEMVTQKIHELGLAGLERRHPKELSGGQKQRVGVARALAVEPDILLLDEAFSALDSFTAAELRRDVMKIWGGSGQSIVMVTHLPAEAVEMADRIIVFSARPGRIISEIKINLPRPRNTRSPEFFKLVDRLEELISPRSKSN